MRVRFGDYLHRIAEVDLQINRRPIENARKVPMAIEELWTCQGKIYNLTGDFATMKASLLAFEKAFAVNGKDLVLENARGQPTHHQLLNRDCIGGTIVVEPPSFPTGKKGENNTFRTYRYVVKGIRPLAKSEWISFSERISIKGGGARWGCIEVNEGEGVRQLLRTNTICYATQSGSATAYRGYPNPPGPIWPYALKDEYADIDIDSPDTYGDNGNGVLLNFGISWSYSFESTFRLLGTPHYLRG